MKMKPWLPGYVVVNEHNIMIRLDQLTDRCRTMRFDKPIVDMIHASRVVDRAIRKMMNTGPNVLSGRETKE